MMAAFRVLAKLKRLRGTPFDVFGASTERKGERRLIGEYEATVAELLEHPGRRESGSSPWRSRAYRAHRGFGHVKRRHLDEAKKKEVALLHRIRGVAPLGESRVAWPSPAPTSRTTCCGDVS